MITIRINFSTPLEMSYKDRDTFTFTISDDLSGLIELSASVIGRMKNE